MRGRADRLEEEFSSREAKSLWPINRLLFIRCGGRQIGRWT